MFKNICSSILSHKIHRVLIVSHLNPDADALGSSLALAIWLESCGYEVIVWNQDILPLSLSFLPSSNRVKIPSKEDGVFDVIFFLDTASQERIGNLIHPLINDIPLSIAIDHHPSNPSFADINFIFPSISSTAEILASSFLEYGVNITPEIAINLFAGISSDSGSFQYVGTSENTFFVAHQLAKSGINISDIALKLFSNKTKNSIPVLQKLLSKIQFFYNNLIVSISLSLEEKILLHFQKEDTDGILHYLRGLRETIIVLFFEEEENNIVRLSVRSKTALFNASNFCQRFGGGGHDLAAGTKISGKLEFVQELVISEIETIMQGHYIEYN